MTYKSFRMNKHHCKLAVVHQQQERKLLGDQEHRKQSEQSEQEQLA